MLEARVDRLEATLQRLAEAQAQTQGELRNLAERMVQLTAQVDRLTAQVDRLAGVVGTLQGESLERRYRERAPASFDDLLRGIQVLSSEALAALLDEAQSRGTVSRDERRHLLEADVVVRGRRWEDEGEAYLAVEVSSVVDESDVRLAQQRAELLARVTGMPTVAAVAGVTITPLAEQMAKALQVWRVLDGKAFPPD